MTLQERISQIARSVTRVFTPAEALLLLAVKFSLCLSNNGDWIFIPIILECLEVVSGGSFILELLRTLSNIPIVVSPLAESTLHVCQFALRLFPSLMNVLANFFGQ